MKKAVLREHLKNRGVKTELKEVPDTKKATTRTTKKKSKKEVE